jgi:putative phosphoribosyl transferase
MAVRLNQLFADRADAAGQLATALKGHRGGNPLVLAIPRGAVPMGRAIADALHGELDVVLVRKLGAPGNPELAIGAIDERGDARVTDYARYVGADEDYVRAEAQRQLELIRARRALYTPYRAPIDPAGRTVIVVDDGLATGATMAAALRAVRARNPARLICAVPVGARDSVAAMASLADEVVCLLTPRDFHSVGQYYANFSEVDDEDVIELLGAGPAAMPVPLQSVSASVSLPIDGIRLEGDLDVPAGAAGIVVFAHGSGSSRKSPRNRFVALELNRRGLATLLFDLMTEGEDVDPSVRFDIGMLADRLDAAVSWTASDPRTGSLPIGLFGASTGAAAALVVAAQRADSVAAVVSRGGRPDLAGRGVLARVTAPTLLIVGGADLDVLDLNRAAQALMRSRVELTVVPGATHLFEEPGTLERVAEHAAAWFQRWFKHARTHDA